MSLTLGTALSVIAILGFIYEVVQVRKQDLTITAQVRALARAWPPSLFLAGVLSGHLFAC